MKRIKKQNKVSLHLVKNKKGLVLYVVGGLTLPHLVEKNYQNALNNSIRFAEPFFLPEEDPSGACVVYLDTHFYPGLVAKQKNALRENYWMQQARQLPGYA